MKTQYAIFLLCTALLLVTACNNQTATEQSEQNQAQIANPASVYCIDHGGIDEIAHDIDGNEYGLCTFSDNTVCDEWAYYRGECKKGDCIRTCNNIGTRSEAWYDCNGNFLTYADCAGQ